MSGLRPCPFCDCVCAYTVYSSDGSCMRVECGACSAMGPATADGPEDARRLWDSRGGDEQ